MNTATCVAIFFALPAVLFPLVAFVWFAVLNAALPSEAKAGRNPIEPGTWWAALLWGGFFGFAMFGGSLYSSINDNWQYAPADAEFPPFPVWWILVAVTMGGVCGAAVIHYCCIWYARQGKERGITK